MLACTLAALTAPAAHSADYTIKAGSTDVSVYFLAEGTNDPDAVIYIRNRGKERGTFSILFGTIVACLCGGCLSGEVGELAIEPAGLILGVGAGFSGRDLPGSAASNTASRSGVNRSGYVVGISFSMCRSSSSRLAQPTR
jgi:hypothetical protein